jgi:hypothetical protein
MIWDERWNALTDDQRERFNREMLRLVEEQYRWQPFARLSFWPDEFHFPRVEVAPVRFERDDHNDRSVVTFDYRYRLVPSDFRWSDVFQFDRLEDPEPENARTAATFEDWLERSAAIIAECQKDHE